MSNTTDFEELLVFIKDFTRTTSPITATTSVNKDLGLDGDDAAELRQSPAAFNT